jgi:hypothetical protein
MKSIDMTRDSSEGPSTPPSPTQRTLRESLGALHGAAIGDALAEIAMAHRQKHAEKLRALQQQLAETNAGLAQQVLACERLLVPLQQRADDLYAQWHAANAATENQRMANEAALAPLRNAAIEIIQELHRPVLGTPIGDLIPGGGPGNTVRQWGQAPTDAPPEAPTFEPLLRT